MNLSFELNPYFLAYYTIANCSSSRFISGMTNPDVVAFQDKAWSIDKEAYNLTRQANAVPLLTKKVFEEGEIQTQRWYHLDIVGKHNSSNPRQR